MKKILLYTMLGLAGLVTSSCSRDEGPESLIQPIKIQNIAPSADFKVGVYYKNVGSGGQDNTRYNRLKEKWDDAKRTTGAHLDLWAGNYTLDQSNPYEDELQIVQQQIDWSLENGIDFWILPALKVRDITRDGVENVADFSQLGGDYNLYKVMFGKKGSRQTVDEEGNVTDPGITVNPKNLQFAATVNIEDPLCQAKLKYYDDNDNLVDKTTAQLSNKILLEENDNVIYVERDAETGEVVRKITRSQAFVELFNMLDEFFSDEHYFCYNGQPVVVLQNAHKLYSKDCKAFYQNLKAAVKAVTGRDIYIVAQQEGSWNPPARGEYFFQGVDAVTNKNMYQNNDWSRSVEYPSFIYYNWDYNRNYYMSHWNIDWIPTGSPAFNGYVDNGNTDKPIVKHDVNTFSAMCNVMKMAAGQNKIFFIDSFNDIQYCSFLEPTKKTDDEGNFIDYGNLADNAANADKTMLEIVKEQFHGK